MSTNRHRYMGSAAALVFVFLLVFTINGCSSPNDPNFSSAASQQPSDNGTIPDISGKWVGGGDETQYAIDATIAQNANTFSGSWVWDDPWITIIQNGKTRVGDHFEQSFHGTIAPSGQITLDATSGGVTTDYFTAQTSTDSTGRVWISGVDKNTGLDFYIRRP